MSCFGVWSLDNELVCSKSNYPFYFLTLNYTCEYIHFPLPQATPQGHKTHKESFVKDMGLEARAGVGLNGRASFQVSEPVSKKCKIGSGKIKHQQV